MHALDDCSGNGWYNKAPQDKQLPGWAPESHVFLHKEDLRGYGVWTGLYEHVERQAAFTTTNNPDIYQLRHVNQYKHPAPHDWSLFHGSFI